MLRQGVEQTQSQNTRHLDSTDQRKKKRAQEKRTSPKFQAAFPQLAGTSAIQVRSLDPFLIHTGTTIELLFDQTSIYLLGNYVLSKHW